MAKIGYRIKFTGANSYDSKPLTIWGRVLVHPVRVKKTFTFWGSFSSSCQEEVKNNPLVQNSIHINS